MSELAVVNLLAINLINLFFFFYFNILPYLTGNTITFLLIASWILTVVVIDIIEVQHQEYMFMFMFIEPLVDSPENVSFLENLLTNFINMDFPCWSYS